MESTAFDRDMEVRLAAFRWLDERKLQGVSEFNRDMLCNGFFFDGERLPLVDWAGKGIRNPVSMRSTLSIRTSVNGVYPDSETDIAGESFEYYYQARSIEGDNTKLRSALLHGDPLIYFHGVRSGWAVPIYPVFVVADDPIRQVFTIDLTRSYEISAPDQVTFEDERRYGASVVVQRLHQPLFRARVMHAYENRCAICRLRHLELLDAAHIIRDRDERGFAHVTNGLALCKLHHAAYDRNLLGIRPDFRVAINHRLLEEIDGPMLRHGLQEMHDERLVLPRRRIDRPSQQALESRWLEFEKA